MRARVLPRNEWSRAESLDGMPISTMEKLGDVKMVVIEDGDKIIARCGVGRFVHFEGLLIDPEHKNAFRPLIREAYRQAREWAPECAIAGAADVNMADVLLRMGASHIPAQFFVLRTEF